MLGQCGTQAVPSCRQTQTEDAALLPTKTSLVNGQKLGSLPFAVNAGFQVALIRFIEAFLRITVVARILSWWNLFLDRLTPTILDFCIRECFPLDDSFTAKDPDGVNGFRE